MPGGCRKARRQHVLPIPDVSENPRGTHPCARGQARVSLATLPWTVIHSLYISSAPNQPHGVLALPRPRHRPFSHSPRQNPDLPMILIKIFRKLSESRREVRNRNQRLQPGGGESELSLSVALGLPHISGASLLSPN